MYYCLVPAAYATTAVAVTALACEEIFHSIPDAYGECVCRYVCCMHMPIHRDIASTLPYNIHEILLFVSRYALSLVYPHSKIGAILCLCACIPFNMH